MTLLSCHRPQFQRARAVLSTRRQECRRSGWEHDTPVVSLRYDRLNQEHVHLRACFERGVGFHAKQGVRIAEPEQFV